MDVEFWLDVFVRGHRCRSERAICSGYDFVPGLRIPVRHLRPHSDLARQGVIGREPQRPDLVYRFRGLDVFTDEV
jgi:hypothetical protein